MEEYTLHLTDVTAHFQAKQQPIYLLKPHWKSAQRFWICQTPLIADQPPLWTVARHGDVVRVPMTAYRTNPGAPMTAIALHGLQAGRKSMGPTNCGLEKERGRRTVHVILSDQVYSDHSDPQQPVYRYAMGFAIEYQGE